MADQITTASKLRVFNKIEELTTRELNSINKNIKIQLQLF